MSSLPEVPIIGNCGVSHEAMCALVDSKQVIETYGHPITVRIRTEANVQRDRYNTIKQFDVVTPIEMKAYPMDFQPNRYRLEAAGLFEECELLIYTSNYDWIAAGLGFEDIDIKRTSFYIRGSMYTIKEKGLASQFADSYLYITFGLYRE